MTFRIAAIEKVTALGRDDIAMAVAPDIAMARYRLDVGQGHRVVDGEAEGIEV